MDTSSILQAIDQQIERLQQVRALLSENAPAKRGPGRPKTSQAVVAELVAPKKRAMSAEGKARIAAAQKKRWEKLAAAKTPKKNTPVAKKPVHHAGKQVVAGPAKKAVQKSAAAPKKAAVESSKGEATS